MRFVVPFPPGGATDVNARVIAARLAKELGCRELWIKDDSCNYPTYSYKERVVAVAISKAVEFGFDTVGCASTGNLANSTAAHAAQAGVVQGVDRLFVGQRLHQVRFDFLDRGAEIAAAGRKVDAVLAQLASRKGGGGKG